jgi:diguanylate cyclase (GGDEF)-like protein
VTSTGGNALTPSTEGLPEQLVPELLLHDGPQCRVTRLHLPGGTVIREQPLGRGSERRLRHERAILERLAGVPGVVQLAAAVAPWPGSILLEDVGGEPLAGVRVPMDAAEVVRLAHELARTLAEMHARGVVHRDINPANILLAGDGRLPYLVDFGFASTTVGEVRPDFTHHSEIVGTLPYLAPEQTGRTGHPVDQRADLYGLGATLYELATGAPPFGTGDPLRLVHDHLARVPVPLAQVNPAIGGALSDIIGHLLEKEPDNRYQTAQGLMYDLRSVKSGSAGAGFRAGEHDYPLRPLPPSRLVGRDAEIATLESAFVGALTGRHRGVLVGGAAGVGKTALINELRPVVTARDGWFLAGKFDLYRRDLEYNAVWQAFSSLGRILLAEPDPVLDDLRSRLRNTLGADAALLAAIYPEFGMVLEVEPDRTIRDPQTLQARLELIGVEVLRAVASPNRPVVLAIDDLQWAVRPAFGFLDRLLGEEALDGVLLVATYREEDVDATHPLAGLLSRWRQETGVELLRLGNLSLSGMAMLLADTLRLDAAQGWELARLITPRTRGNPYDTVEQLSSLLRAGLLELTADGWRWDAAATQSRLGRADLADPVARRAEALPLPTLDVVQAMACLGGRVALNLLQTATGASADQLQEHLAPALADGLVVMDTGHEDTLRFRHDQVQEAILARLGHQPERALRLSLARRLAEVPELFAVAAEQYLPVVDAVRERTERHRVASLLSRAAEQAQLISDFAREERCLRAATALVDGADSAALLEVLARHHTALYSLGRLDQADQVAGRLDQLSRTPVQRTDATLVQISSLTNRNRLPEAVQLSLELLRQLGCPAPEPEQRDAEVERDLDALYRWAGQSDDSDDLRPEITDPTLLATGAVLNRAVAPAFFLDQTLTAWLALRAWRIWQQSGPARALVGPACQVAQVIIGRRHDHHTGFRVMRRIMATSEAKGYEPETSHARFLYALWAWRVEPLEECIRLGRRAREGLTRGGDLQNACFSYYVTLAGLLDSAPLEAYLAEVDAALAFARRTGSAQVAEAIEVFHRWVSLLRGPGARPAIKEIGVPESYPANPAAVASVHLARALAAAVFGDQAELLAQTGALMPALRALSDTYLTAIGEVLRALALAELVRATPAGERDPVLGDLDRSVARVASVASSSPANFLHLLRLIEGERAWAVNDVRAASAALDAATRSAATGRRPWHQALILERAARFHRAQGMEYVSDRLLADARSAHQAWGATAKVNQLDWAYPTQPSRSAGAPGTGAARPDLPAGPASLAPGAVDLAGVLSASEALTSETSIDALRERVVDVLTTMTGATGVHLLLWNDDADGWVLSTPDRDDGSGTIPLDIPLDQARARRLLPASVVCYAQRTFQPLVVGDATCDERFSRDPYLSDVERCSLLAIPVRYRGATSALLILENRLIRDAFTPDRLDGVVLIAGQLGVALNNTMVYASLERKVAERTEELARANDRLERLSLTDALTGLANRRRLEEVLAGEWDRGHRSATPVALAMIDVDDFKRYNDRYGHVAGDRCLHRLAALLERYTGEVELAARYGGEEFAIVMPGIDLDAALERAEQLRQAVVELKEPHPVDRELVVTVSIGVAAMTPTADHGAEHLAELADIELYRAKRGGRNRVMPSGPMHRAGGRDRPRVAPPHYR